MGPWWLERAIRGGEEGWSGFGAGDYLAVTASYDLFKLKMLPEIRHVFENVLGIGRFWAGDKIIEIRNGGLSTGEFLAHRQDDPMWARIILRSASAIGGLESSTAKAAWLDECGMDDFPIDAWEAVLRRLSIHQGPILGTSTPYNYGWMKQEVFDRWRAGDEDYNVVQFASTVNPVFPVAEYDRAKATMPDWKFGMMYKGEFERPGNLIYGDFDFEDIDGKNIIAPFDIPAEWPRYCGMDFGAVNTAVVWIAVDEESGNHYLYRECLEGGLTTAEYTSMINEKSPDGMPLRVWGGSKSEVQQRRDFNAAGLSIAEPPASDVEAGINRVIALIKTRSLKVFRDCRGIIDELGRYRRKADRSGNILEAIADKESFHRLDALRYVAFGLSEGFEEAAGEVIQSRQYSIEG